MEEPSQSPAPHIFPIPFNCDTNYTPVFGIIWIIVLISSDLHLPNYKYFHAKSFLWFLLIKLFVTFFFEEYSKQVKYSNEISTNLLEVNK